MSKKQLILEYCNLGQAYLEAKLLPEGKQVLIPLEDYQLEEGVIKNIDDVAALIGDGLGLLKLPPITLVLRCRETYKTFLSLPTMGKMAANSAFQKETKLKKKSSEKSEVKFVTYSNFYRHSLGFIFNTYNMPKNIVDSFRIAAKLLKSKIERVLPAGIYYQEALGNVQGTFAHFYIKRNVCTMILVSGKTTVSTYDTEFETEADIVNKFVLVMSKHEFEFGHCQINRYTVDSDIPIMIELGETMTFDSGELS